MAENLDILNAAVSLLIRAALLTVKQNPTLVAQPPLRYRRTPLSNTLL